MSSIRIYHNPRCSKSRQTLALLEEQGVTAEIIKYLDTPPSKAELKSVLKALGLSARQLMRTKETEYSEQGLSNPELTEEQLIDAMLATPKLIERPIVTNGDKAAIGRPPEQVLEII
ncbi:arsenate reductase (glutaredoxin) [Alginatibacterium sediminis]|uniref:Arsenate reductase n=1 Tax=Alginatibacterium sediminis TaxID=2164068 RepID=A0A420EBL8_9ALTE|nr:arsenate reductase (glutaredoxin) [Alginatibacterium sediminis]RKF18054.1 arsenate reductase (glutaredoxin) [Alginatibacterium sediminis]